MANVLVENQSLQDIADAIREKNGEETLYKPGDMAAAIEAIPSGGVTPTGELEITANGTYDVTNYASADVNVSGGTPTGTKEISITQNGTTTEDVTNYASAEITVNVPSSSFSAMTVKIKNGKTTQIAINRVTYNSTTILSAARANVNADATVTYTDMATDGQYIFFDSSSGTTVSYNDTTATFNRSSTKFRVKIPDNFDSSIPFVIS